MISLCLLKRDYNLWKILFLQMFPLVKFLITALQSCVLHLLVAEFTKFWYLQKCSNFFFNYALSLHCISDAILTHLCCTLSMQTCLFKYICLPLINSLHFAITLDSLVLTRCVLQLSIFSPCAMFWTHSVFYVEQRVSYNEPFVYAYSLLSCYTLPHHAVFCTGWRYINHF